MPRPSVCVFCNYRLCLQRLTCRVLAGCRVHVIFEYSPFGNASQSFGAVFIRARCVVLYETNIFALSSFYLYDTMCSHGHSHSLDLNVFFGTILVIIIIPYVVGLCTCSEHFLRSFFSVVRFILAIWLSCVRSFLSFDISASPLPACPVPTTAVGTYTFTTHYLYFTALHTHNVYVHVFALRWIPYAFLVAR